jgi:phosphoribosylformylglycinamidine synthase
MRIAIVQFPGSNCERETMLSVKRAGMEPVPFLWNNQSLSLADFDGYIIVGGFSYEDRGRAGVLAAMDPIMGTLRTQGALGKPILGICNGAQILVEAGLVPGLVDGEVGVALTDNKQMQKGHIVGTGYYNAWIHMRVANDCQANAFTRFLTSDDVLRVPVAHAQGRFVMAEALLNEMQSLGLTMFQYCDTDGTIQEHFPINPNASMGNIAALSNTAGNVMAMMPHPERTGHGDAIFHSMRDFIEQKQKVTALPLTYQVPKPALTHYQSKGQACIVKLTIVDNEARSIEGVLHRMGIPVSVVRYDHWTLVCESDQVYQQIIQSGVLYNERKAMQVNDTDLRSSADQTLLLVQAHEDMVGPAKQQLLTHHFGIQGIQSIRHSVLWGLAANGYQDQPIQSILNSGILFNRNAHDCYDYNEA